MSHRLPWPVGSDDGTGVGLRRVGDQVSGIGLEQFRITERRSNLAFGHGVHLCVGAPLARLEGEIALRMLFERLPDIRLDIAPRDVGWILGPKLRSPREVPVAFDAR